MNRQNKHFSIRTMRYTLVTTVLCAFGLVLATTPVYGAVDCEIGTPTEFIKVMCEGNSVIVTAGNSRWPYVTAAAFHQVNGANTPFTFGGPRRGMFITSNARATVNRTDSGNGRTGAIRVQGCQNLLGQGCSWVTQQYAIPNGTTPTPPPPPPPPPPPASACSDGKDNDRDGKFDYPKDKGCDSSTDNDETNGAPPTLNFVATPSTIERGDSTTLSWSASGTGRCRTSGVVSNGTLPGSVTVTPEYTTSYYIVCLVDDELVHAIVRVTVIQPPAGTLDFVAIPATLTNPGETATLTWSTQNMRSCTPSSYNPTGALQGSVVLVPDRSTAYTLTCVDGQESSKSKVVVVSVRF